VCAKGQRIVKYERRSSGGFAGEARKNRREAGGVDFDFRASYQRNSPMDSQDQRKGGHLREGVAHYQNEALVGCPSVGGGILYNLGTNKGTSVPPII